MRQKSVDLVAIERPPTTAASKHKPRPGLNDISVLSKVCYGHSLRLGKAVIWRIMSVLSLVGSLGWQRGAEISNRHIATRQRRSSSSMTPTIARDAPDRRQQNRRNVPPVE